MKKQIKELKELVIAYRIAEAFDGYCLAPSDLDIAQDEFDGVTLKILKAHQGSSSSELVRKLCSRIDKLASKKVGAK